MHMNEHLQELSTKLLSQVGNVYICQVTITGSDGRSVSMLGEGKNVDEAQDKALQKALDTARNASHFLEGVGAKKGPLENEPQVVREALTETPYDSKSGSQGHQCIQVGRSQTLQDKASLNGGGAKEATERQREFIQTLATERNRNVEEVCRRVCNCSFKDLQGQDANKVIKAIKGK